MPGLFSMERVPVTNPSATLDPNRGWAREDKELARDMPTPRDMVLINMDALVYRATPPASVLIITTAWGVGMSRAGSLPLRAHPRLEVGLVAGLFLLGRSRAVDTGGF
ncbi:hypothetical protein B0A55_02298 [Friedmanniomyces simplex]|uniref:Uncharacterized protein n=1 Tax=Friedmanniomyces simplex TaxID=329884 RepID=A0A4U0Y2D5_9PEZI|nr:hypothetical protein B0A55_02298 [Friedmanniomyces simplex]